MRCILGKFLSDRSQPALVLFRILMVLSCFSCLLFLFLMQLLLLAASRHNLLRVFRTPSPAIAKFLLDGGLETRAPSRMTMWCALDGRMQGTDPCPDPLEYEASSISWEELYLHLNTQPISRIIPVFVETP